MRQRVLRQVERVAERYRRWRLWRNLAILWLALGFLSAAAQPVCRYFSAPGHASAVTLGLIAIASAISVWVVCRRTARDPLWTARKIEAAFPELDARLLASLERRSNGLDEVAGYLEHAVVHQTLQHARDHDWRASVPRRRFALSRVLHFAALSVAAFALFALDRFPAPAERLAAATDSSPVVVDDATVTIDPGDAEVELGADLLVLARFAEESPADVALRVHPEDASAGDERRLAMAKSLDDPVFGGRIPAITGPIRYQVAFDGSVTREFRVSVFEYPRLLRADATITYPEYTGLDDASIDDTLRVSAVEGSDLVWTCHVNKPLARAELIADGTTGLVLTRGQDATTFIAKLRCEKTMRYRLRLVDDKGRENQQSPTFVLTVLENRVPELKLAFPIGDQQVSPLEELHLAATAWDDFGLEAYGMEYALAGRESKTLVLGKSASAQTKHPIRHLLSLEQLGAQPDQLVSYHFWAEDLGPDGKPRRTVSDMTFAEVRHFEEIFRQGQQPPGGQEPGNQGMAGQATELLDLQKQIVTATWNLMRRPTASSAEPNKGLLEEVGVVRESQQTAVTQATGMAEKLRDTESKSHLAKVIERMREAAERLTVAEGAAPPIDGLEQALPIEQSAYAALLKLRAREHQVSRAQQGGGGGGGGAGRSQQQLQQLELDASKNRYETKRTAQDSQATADRERNQVLNRLKELARRQTDVNQRLQELQSALERAESSHEKERIERELKRLREQQRQMLRDLDKLRERMDRPENQSRMAESQKQLDDTRSNVRRASEALEKGKVSQALNEGTRAERDLRQLSDDFRKRSARQFTEEMKDLRSEARELADRQQRIGEQIDESDGARRKSLRDARDRGQIAEQLDEQKKRLKELLDRMRAVTEEAETAEPLLAKRLYDALRKTGQSKIDQSLDLTGEWLRRGFVPQAEQSERLARAGIDELRDQVDRAARGVLGDDREAMRRAREELAELSEQLQREIDRNDPESAPRDGSRENAEARSTPDGRESDSPQSDAQRRLADASGARPADKDARSKAGKTGVQSKSPARGREDAPEKSASGRNEAQSKARESSRGSSRASAPGGGDPKDAESGSENRPPASGAGDDQPSRPQAPGSTPGESGAPRFFEEGGFTTGPGGPITEGGFRQWSDRLRDVEEMLDDPRLRAEVARVRDRAGDVRAEQRRHSTPPNWSLVREMIARPLEVLRNRIGEELARLEPGDGNVPIDRDPVPRRFSERVRRYYRRLGSGQ